MQEKQKMIVYRNKKTGTGKLKNEGQESTQNDGMGEGWGQGGREEGDKSLICEALITDLFVPVIGVSEVFRKNKKGGCYHPR